MSKKDKILKLELALKKNVINIIDNFFFILLVY